MSSLVLIGGAVIVGLSFISDPQETVKLATAAITIRGATFLSVKIAETQNKQTAEIINMTGWALAGIPIVGMLDLSLQPLVLIGEGITKFKDTCQGFANWVNGLAFWK